MKARRMKDESERRLTHPSSFTPSSLVLSVLFSELSLEQFRELDDGVLRVVAVGVNAHLRAFGGGEDDHLHDALAVGLAGLLAELHHPDVALELVGHVHELHRRPRVQAELVRDDDVTGGGVHKTKDEGSKDEG